MPERHLPGSIPHGATKRGGTTRGTSRSAQPVSRDETHLPEAASRGLSYNNHHRRLRGNPASAIYGSIMSASLLVVSASLEKSLRDVVVLIISTLIVFWLAHAYTDAVGDGVSFTGTSSFPVRKVFGHHLRAQWPIVESALLPVATLLVLSLFGAKLDTALFVALLVDVVELFGWGVLASRRMQMPRMRAIVFVLFTGSLGLIMVLLKVLVH
ncbi:hypothetical protein SAMN05444157_0267 [Frankineae bacterium MT45]|nr:hypothetical protein SAMN05444157_0267 [Frankineae bacterium MT45]